jgi:ABC-type uncharacterized transport system auxiliary subunit
MRWMLVLLSSLLLAGCFTQGKRGGDTSLAIYDLGPMPERLVRQQRKIPVAIEVRAPLWFDSLGIDYRLQYADAARLREYAKARWAAPPAQLIEQRLMHQLAFSSAGQARAGCVLRLDISEFSQIFSGPASSAGVLRLRAKWLDQSRRPAAEQDFNIEKIAISSDSRGGVRALTAAVEQLASELRAWETNLVETGKAAGCGS